MKVYVRIIRQLLLEYKLKELLFMILALIFNLKSFDKFGIHIGLVSYIFVIFIVGYSRNTKENSGSAEELDLVNAIIEKNRRKFIILRKGLPREVNIRIIEDKFMNIYTEGYNTIYLSSRVFELSEDELEAVICHELGHMANFDTYKLGFYSRMNLYLAIFYVLLSLIFKQEFLPRDIWIILLYLILFLLGKKLYEDKRKEMEFDADDIVVACGYLEALNSFFERKICEYRENKQEIDIRERKFRINK